MIVVVLWVLLTLVFGFWTAARASSKGYSFGKFLFLGLLFGPFAWLATYSLPTKLAGETIGQAGGRAVTSGVLNVAEGARDAGRARSPGIARGVGAVATRAAMNAAGGARDAVAERRASAGEGVITEDGAEVEGEVEGEGGATPRRGLAANLATRATRTAMNAADGAREAAAERRQPGEGEAEAAASAAPPARGLAANLAKRATRTAFNVAESARTAAAEHRTASTGAKVIPVGDGGESIEDRLNRLESLRERGLLSDDEYQGRRDAIIAEL